MLKFDLTSQIINNYKPDNKANKGQNGVTTAEDYKEFKTVRFATDFF